MRRMLESLRQINFLALDVDGTLTEGDIPIGENGFHFKSFAAKDGIAIRRLQDSGCRVGIISHSIQESAVRARASMLGIEYLRVGKDFEKGEQLQVWQQELGLKSAQIAVMGDQVNDLTMFSVAGFSICPSDAIPSIREIADIVLSSSGGKGCVAEWADYYFFPAQAWTN
ncbi:MAG: HAD hydrolase family protein [Cytophagales bacterium]|nr:HAD hydrolase family protein [Cytophagales bacterium]